MDEAASDLSQGVVALSNVAEQAGVNKLIGGYEDLTGLCGVDQADVVLTGCQKDLHQHLQRSMCPLYP